MSLSCLSFLSYHSTIEIDPIAIFIDLLYQAMYEASPFIKKRIFGKNLCSSLYNFAVVDSNLYIYHSIVVYYLH